MAKDPFNAYNKPVLNRILNSRRVGSSLTLEPGSMPYEKPKMFTSDIAFMEDDVVPSFQSPDTVRGAVQLLALGVSPQAVSYMYVTDAMSKGLINPDVAELARPQIEAIILQRALEIDPEMNINMPVGRKTNTPSRYNMLEAMKNGNPKMYTKLMETQNNIDKEKNREKAKNIIDQAVERKNKDKIATNRRGGFLKGV